MTDRPTSIDAYLSAFPDDVAAILERVRATVHAAVPGAGESISYRLPTITLDGRALIHFAGWTSFISVYPLPAADDSVDAELAPYRAGAGTARFPLDAPIPYELIGRLAALLAHQRSTRSG